MYYIHLKFNLKTQNAKYLMQIYIYTKYLMQKIVFNDQDSRTLAYFYYMHFYNKYLVTSVHIFAMRLR